MCNKWHLMLLAIPLLSVATKSEPVSTPEIGINTEASAAMIVRYSKRPGLTDAHNAYQFELIEKAMEITRPEYGDYSIQPYALAPTAKRQAILLNTGDLINVQWASPGTPISRADVIPIPVDILKGLLGYRVCLINKANTQSINEFKALKSLANIKVGQGQDWTDTAIYYYNNITLVEAPSLEGLLRMMALQRFDCLALGINEVLFIYDEIKSEFPFLNIEQNLLIYYEFPTLLYVSRKYPQLAARLTLGLNRMKHSGEFEQLFNQYFAKNIEPLHLQNRKIICLQSPYPNNKDQCTKPIALP